MIWKVNSKINIFKKNVYASMFIVGLTCFYVQN